MQQYEPRIRWGLIIFFFILFFPVGFIVLFIEYKNKRNALVYGRLLKTWGAIFLCLGIFYAIFFSAVPLTSETGEVLSQSQRSSLSAMMFIFFTSFGLPMRISGKRKIKGYIKEQETIFANSARSNMEQMLEQSIPKYIMECPGCGAKLKAGLGTTAKCEYCGNEFNT